MAGQGGRAFSNLAEVPVLRPINEAGTSGKEIPDGEIEEIFYHPPIVFLGYYNMHEKTAKAVSKKGILYTSDLGHFKDMGSYRALYLAGGRKFVTKQKGYNVFPAEIESHIAGLEGVDVAEFVGIKHDVFDEEIFTLVRP